MLILGQVSDTANQILSEGIDSQEAIRVAMNQLWDAVITNQGLYAAIANLGVFFAVSTLMLFVVQWTKAMLEAEDTKAFGELIWPLLIVFLLANNGAVLATSTKELRTLVNQVNLDLYNESIVGINLGENYQRVIAEENIRTQVKALYSQCQSVVDTFQQRACLERAASQSEQLINPSGAPLSNRLKNWIGNIIENPIGATVGATMNTVVRGWLMAFGVAFQWLIEISMLLTALLGPLAVGASLLPVGGKAIYAWLTAFFSLGIAKLSFNIIVGLVATMVAIADTNDPMIFAFAVGLGAPILSLALASGGGMAVFNSLVQGGKFVFGRAVF